MALRPRLTTGLPVRRRGEARLILVLDSNLVLRTGIVLFRCRASSACRVATTLVWGGKEIPRPSCVDSAHQNPLPLEVSVMTDSPRVMLWGCACLVDVDPEVGRS